MGILSMFSTRLVTTGPGKTVSSSTGARCLWEEWSMENSQLNLFEAVYKFT